MEACLLAKSSCFRTTRSALCSYDFKVMEKICSSCGSEKVKDKYRTKNQNQNKGADNNMLKVDRKSWVICGEMRILHFYFKFVLMVMFRRLIEVSRPNHPAQGFIIVLTQEGTNRKLFLYYVSNQVFLNLNACYPVLCVGLILFAKMFLQD